MTTHIVTATRLNFRSSPEQASHNRIAVLDQDTPLTLLAADVTPGWSRVEVELQGRLIQGFVASRFLAPSAGSLPPPTTRAPTPGELPPAHLPENNLSVTRFRDGGRAHPLGEPGQPGLNGNSPPQRASDLVSLAEYLDSESAQHKRYQRKGGTTFCNIYAYDFCYLAGVYLPRVWWKANALREISNGGHPPVSYGQTVSELNANDLHDWFSDHGAAFRWQREFDVAALQAAANQGEICIIVAQRVDRNRSGHITVVAPEHPGVAAARNANGVVVRPVESQAGASNHRFITKRTRWWHDNKFASFGFWRNRKA